MSLEGKTALVTGGSRGIGKAIVWALARAGAKVAFVYQSSKEAADQLVSDLALDQHEAIAIQADVKDKEAADAAVAQVLEKWEKIDILVNNAGIIRDTLLAQMSSQQWQEVIDTNLTSVFNFCQAVTRPMMSARYGRIINMSSVAAEFGNSGQVNYASSKAGIIGFTRCLATELARRGVTVKPFSAKVIAGANRRSHGRRPWLSWTEASNATVPGAPTDRPPTTASKNFIGVPSGFRNSVSATAMGAVSRPS
jgi:3-oxoacyl-[acyl-carrier protein] reductase